MFDLEGHIVSWRQSFTQVLGNRIETIDELEAHLRDDVERLVGEGRTPEQAWEQALRRLGTPRQLAAEFHKHRSPHWWAAWFAVAGLALSAVAGAWISLRLLEGRRGSLLAIHVFTVCLGYASVFAVGFLSLWATVTRALRSWDSPRDIALRTTGARLALVAAIATAIGAALGTLWAHAHLGRWWAWDPRELGGVAVLAWSLLLLRSFRGAAPTAMLLLMGIMGNLVVALSWFGPVLIENNHSYGFSVIGMWVGLFVESQMIAIYVGLAFSAMPTADSPLT